MQPSHVVRADFDRLAPLSDDDWSHNSHYHAYLLRHLLWRYSLVWRKPR
jgi:hypothetical protein